MMSDNASVLPVEAAVSAATLRPSQATRLRYAPAWQARVAPQWPRFRTVSGFTLAELLVTIGVLVLLVLLFTQFLNSAATVTTLGHKQMDADSQARELLDRMALDVMQMVKRSDVYYHLKASTSATDCPATEPDGSPGCWTQTGNDEIAFYSNVPGYFPSTVPNSNQRSSVSIVGYRMHVS